MSMDNETEVLASQEENHSAPPLRHTSNDARLLHKLGKKPPIRWPKMKEVEKWAHFEKEVLAELSPFPMSIIERIGIEFKPPKSG